MSKKFFIFAGTFFVFSLLFGGQVTFAAAHKMVCPVNVSTYSHVDDDCVIDVMEGTSLHVTPTGNLCLGPVSADVVVNSGGVVQLNFGGTQTFYLKSGSTLDTDSGSRFSGTIYYETGATIDGTTDSATLIHCGRIVITGNSSANSDDHFCRDSSEAAGLGCSF